MITRKNAAEMLNKYLRHEITLNHFVDWAENALMQEDFESAYIDSIRDVIAQIGLADTRAFGLTWEDYEKMFERLGYTVKINVEAALKK
jgi:hypothetical protein